MKFFGKLSGASLIASLCLFAACDKTKDPVNTMQPAGQISQKACNLTKVIQSNFYSEYLYDTNNKVIRINHFSPTDSTLLLAYAYTYNSAGKAAEELQYNSNNIVERRQVFTYNTNNLLARIDIYDSNEPGGINQLSEYFLFLYNNAGKRILAEHYTGTLPGTMDRYSEYMYNQSTILEKVFDARTSPATVADTITIVYDNNRSVYSNLGYLNAFFPDFDKNNIIEINRSAGGQEYDSFYHYEYDNLGYPIKVEHGTGMFLSGTTFEYDCQ